MQSFHQRCTRTTCLLFPILPILIASIFLTTHAQPHYGTTDLLQIKVDNRAVNILFNETRSSSNLLEEFTVHALNQKDQAFLMQRIRERQQQQSFIRQHAVPINIAELRRTIDLGLQQLQCENSVNHGNFGGSHYIQTRERVVAILEPIQHQITHNSVILSQCLCILLQEVQHELSTLKKQHPSIAVDQHIYSNAISYRWFAEIGFGLVVLSKARQSFAPVLPEPTTTYMHLALHFLDASNAIQFTSDCAYAAAIVHRTLGNYNKAANMYRKAALERFGTLKAAMKRSPFTQDTEIFHYENNGDAGTAAHSTQGIGHHLMHEANQLYYLIEQHVPPFFSRQGNQTKEWLGIAVDLEQESDRLVELYNAAEFKRNVSVTVLGALSTRGKSMQVHGKILHIASTPALTHSHVFGKWNPKLLEQTFFETNVAYQDDFLSPEALHNVRSFLWESTIFLYPKGDPSMGSGYLGSYLESGFGSSGLILQIAGELASKLPGIIGKLRLVQAWAYKYTLGNHGTHDARGIDIHADEALVNVNFWITPDDARLSGGGLIVYDKKAPKAMNFDEINKDQTFIRRFLEGSKSHTIDYKSNRMVVFDSRLFHRSQDFKFKRHHTKERINLTFLYGDR